MSFFRRVGKLRNQQCVAAHCANVVHQVQQFHFSFVRMLSSQHHNSTKPLATAPTHSAHVGRHVRPVDNSVDNSDSVETSLSSWQAIAKDERLGTSFPSSSSAFLKEQAGGQKEHPSPTAAASGAFSTFSNFTFPLSSTTDTSAASNASGKVRDRIDLSKIARSIHLSSSAGYDWIDFTADPSVQDEILLDGGFVSATRKMLRKHDVPDELIRKVSDEVWLPLTHLSLDSDSVCFVTRVAHVVRSADEVDLHHRHYRRGVGNASGGLKRGLGNVLSSVRELEPEAKKEFSLRTHISRLKRLCAILCNQQLFAAIWNFGTAKMRYSSPQGEGSKGETILQLSERLTIFLSKKHKKIISVHRAPMPFIETLQLRWAEKHRHEQMEVLFYRLVRGSVSTFHESEVMHAVRLDQLESILFHDDFAATREARAYGGGRAKKGNPAAFKEHAQVVTQLQGINRQASANVRVLREVHRAYSQAVDAMKFGKVVNHVRSKELSQHVGSALFLSEGLRDQSQALLSLQVSVAVSKLEDLVRLLTAYSTVFIPLEFITSFFGTNFITVCELGESPYGFWVPLVLMVIAAILTQRWVNKTTSLFV